MPNIETLQLLAREFKVSLNELLAGEKLADEDFRLKAEENVVAVSKISEFSFEERKTYFKTKWRKEHSLLFVVLFLILVASIILPFVFDKPYLVSLAPLLAVIEYGYQNNKMMIYVEKISTIDIKNN